MPAPIVFRPQYGPWDNLLPALFLNKIRHKQDMEREELRIKARQSQQKEVGKTGAKMAGWKEVPKSSRMHMEKSGTAPSDIENIFGTWMRRPSEKKFTPRTLEIGGIKLIETSPNKFTPKKEETDTTDIKNYNLAVQQGYKGDFENWVKSVKRAGAPKISIGEKGRQETEAYFKKPKFRSDIINDVKRIRGRMWEIMEPNEQQALIKSEADIRVKNTYPNAKYGKDDATGEIGWFVPEGEGHKLVVPWRQ